MTFVRRIRLGLLSTFCGVAAFLATQSWEILNPLRFGYLWGSGDISSSFISWIYFRQTSLWLWPISSNPNLGQPWTRGILFTDTPPILAVPLKYLGHALPQTFQYTGFQILISMILIVYFTAKSLRCLRVDNWTSLLGGVLVATAPFLIFRDQFHHYSLNILWAVTAAIYLVVRTSKRFPTLAWSGLVFVTLTWMPYFVVPVLMLWLPSLLFSQHQFPRSLRKWAFDVLLPLVSALLALLVDGFWSNAEGSGGFGLGYYNANLLALINPLATPSSVWSRVIPGFANATEGQYEGFAYVGLGGLLLIAVCGTVLALKPTVLAHCWNSNRARSLICSALIAGISATALSVQLGTFHLFSVTLPDRLMPYLSIFRSSGRFMLLVALILLVSVITLLSRAVSRSLCITLVAGALVLTYVDSRDQIAGNIQQEQGQSQLTDGIVQAGNFLDTHVDGVKQVIFIEPENSAYTWKMDILAATAFRNIPANDDFVARANLVKLSAERDRTRALFDSGTIHSGTMWVIYPAFAERHRASVMNLQNSHCWTSIRGAYLISSQTCEG